MNEHSHGKLHLTDALLVGSDAFTMLCDVRAWINGYAHRLDFLLAYLSSNLWKLIPDLPRADYRVSVVYPREPPSRPLRFFAASK